MNHIMPPPQQLLPILGKVKEIYLLWYGYYQTLPKLHKHSLGQRIDTLLVETIEAIAVASFLGRDEKLPYIRIAIRKLDTLKILLMVLLETKSLDNKRYITLSVKIDEMGKMLGGWSGQLRKKTLPLGERNEMSCGNRRRVVAVPVVVESVVVPVPLPIVEVQISYVQIAVGVAVT